eukprot:gnl/MRDRNA2_/MRDRNA2_150577_c0_seq1.p1 gnl/MRDRNA2_/MRDRNA2_150577_c0~~gnl/MRDRNA2_/MRDRNA2_150577_c0_seq1.p1  ORF type:complete len:520 (+),score=123.05 gnl/MRDRNA2_/MRDRNA2_150577_c0_seq1:169-1560(+)
MPDATAEWVKMKGSWFNQGEEYGLDSGWMSLAEAKQKCLSYGDKAAGFTYQDEGDESGSFCYIVKSGTQMYGGGPFSTMVYKVMLPPDDGTLFEDDFAETDDYVDAAWIRPGRGGGLGDDKKSIVLFGSIDSSDLGQGGIGDCWLISAFAALAEFPEQVKALFSPQSIPADGQYTITLYSFAEGQNKQIVIDDRIPGNIRPQYVDITSEGEIWPCLLEKAFAKYSGSYEELDGGVSQFAFGALTGCTDLCYCNNDANGWHVNTVAFKSDQVHGDCDIRNEADPSNEEFLQMLADWDNNNYLLAAGSHSGSDSDKNALGIVQGHAYTILQVKMNVAGSGYDLMQLRNPWGCSEWSGAWSDNSGLWNDNPDVAEECGWEQADDGLFWMTYDDFSSNYQQVFVCRKNMGENRGKIQTRDFQCPNPSISAEVDQPKKVSKALQNKRTLVAKFAKKVSACGGEACSIM